VNKTLNADQYRNLFMKTNVTTPVLAFASGACSGNDATFWLGLALALACGVSYALSRRTPPGDMLFTYSEDGVIKHRERWSPEHGWVEADTLPTATTENVRTIREAHRAAAEIDRRLLWLYHNDPYVRRMVDRGIARESEHDGPL
jgi:hypothetical protein